MVPTLREWLQVAHLLDMMEMQLTCVSLRLHHILQTQNGPIAEMSQTFHKTNHGIIHINPNTIPSDINRAVFDTWRK